MNERRLLALLTITLMLTSNIVTISLNLPAMAQGSARLTGNVFSYGEDIDHDGYYNLLVINVEVNVSQAGIYRVQVDALKGSFDYLWLYDSNMTYLGDGIQNVTFKFNGILIYGRRLDVSSVYAVSLYEDGSYYAIDFRNEIPLSTIHYWTMFDIGAELTGVAYDEGVDIDSDGLYDFLLVGIELNVSDEAWYEVRISNLLNSSYYFVNTESSNQEFLSAGIHVVDVWIYGAEIYASRVNNISMISWVYLYIVEDYPQDLAYDGYLSLSETYDYSDFETFAYFTGNTSDEGVDLDMDGKLDHLLIGVEFNVTEAGDYNVQLESLVDSSYNYFDLYQFVSGFYEVGVHWANFSVYGPMLYAARFSPMYVGAISLRNWMNLDTRFNVPLSHTYDYADFESHATLTGAVYDSGVDSDGDGLFDYLTVGFEINVSEAGRYRVSALGLEEQVGNYSSWIWDYQSVEDEFDVGAHFLYLNFSGSMLAYRCFSPTHVKDVTLEEIAPYNMKLEGISSASLSLQYHYTLFNAPMTDVQVNFIVYPSGEVCVSGEANSTHVYPPNTGPKMEAEIALSTNGNQTLGRANGTITMPAGTWPFNATSAYLLGNQNNGLLNASLEATVFMPTGGNMYPFNSTNVQLSTVYSDGILDMTLQGDTAVPSYQSMYVFNISDVTLLADYAGDEIEGNVTFRTIAGFPLSEVISYFQGNKTHIYASGNMTVVYGNYFGTEINATTIEEMLANINSTFPGQGENSIYNVTGGLLECTRLDTARTPLMSGENEYASLIEYDVTIEGNFTGYVATLVAYMVNPYDSEEIYQSVYAALESTMSSVQSGSLELIYWHTTGTGSVNLSLRSDVKELWTNALELVPPTLPPELSTQVEAMLKMANASAYALQDFGLNASYSSSEQKLDLEVWLLGSTSQLEDNIKSLLPEFYPPEMRDIVEAYLNTTYCELKSSSATLSYANETADFEMNWTVEGDFNAQVNHVKKFYVDIINASDPYTPEWMYRLINETEMDIDNLEFEVKLGEDYVHFSFDGLRFKPPQDRIDHVRFRLYEFFNFTYIQPEPPQAYQRMRLSVDGGANATHVILLYAPDTMPGPSSASLNYTSMNWSNNTLSTLTDLQFLTAYLGTAEYAGTNYYVPIFSNSTVSGFGFNQNAKKISFSVEGAADSRGFCNLTIPRVLLYANVSEWIITVEGQQLPPEEFSVVENGEYAFVYFEYLHSTRLIEVTGTSVISEFQADLLPLLLTIVLLVAAVIVVKQKKQIEVARRQARLAITAITTRIHQTET